MRRGNYYLGRVTKSGNLDQSKLIQAICDSKTVSIGKHLWEFTDTENHINGSSGYLFSRLTKYSSEGKVKVVDPDTHTQKDDIAENLLVASSPFIYLPSYSGIAYLHVWNHIEEKKFRKQFQTLVEEAYDRFFVGCQIEPISDYRAFAAKLRELDKFSEIHAKVQPPNPLFGDLWKKLHEYIKERNADEIRLTEKSDTENGLKTEIVDLIDSIVHEKIHKVTTPASLTDAAILMAADGYGSARVAGDMDSKSVTIRTSETQKSFLFSKEPDPEELAKTAEASFASISKERDMKH